MSIALYDEALSNKIKSWVLDPNVRILYPDESSRFFDQIADQNKDKLNLPLISISRDRQIDIKITAKRYAQSYGKTFNGTESLADGLRFIPISINYQVDIYTRYREEADAYFRDFVFNIINYPALTIQIPYKDSNLKQTTYMTLGSIAQDNSDIPERLIAGQFTRMTLNIALNDAKLYAYNIKPIPKVKQIDVKGSMAKISASVGEQGNHYIDDSCEELSHINIDND